MPSTPLRYPGGKQRLTPFIGEILEANGLIGEEYAEPYAGGAGVAMELLLSKKSRHVHLNDSCVAVYSFWKSILEKPEEFCRKVQSVALSPEEWKRQREILRRPAEFDFFDLGFSMFYLNRCNRSGILDAGMIGGKAQTGTWKIDARFPRIKLVHRIEAIAEKKDSISIYNLDAEDFLKRIVSKLPDRTLIYCDPPYFKKAERLYLNHYKPADHKRIAEVIQDVRQRWIVSYDDAPEIAEHYHCRRSFKYSLQYSAGRYCKGVELFFFGPSVILPLRSAIPSIDDALMAM